MIPLFKGADMDKIRFATENYLELGVAERENSPLVLVAPGGAYRYTSSREAAPVRDVFLEAGYHSGIIYYRETLLKHPDAVSELAEFVSFVRKNAEKYKIDPDRIALVGFSAGGHYVANLGVSWEKYGKESRPNALILAYPVITGIEGFAHDGSIQNLFGCLTPEAREEFSLERRAGSHTPPTFLFHTADDGAVPVENSLLFFQALRKAGVKADLHIYQEGPHGLALANAKTPPEEADPAAYAKKYARVAGWVDLAIKWLGEIFR